jgi:hypothetical protein
MHTRVKALFGDLAVLLLTFPFWGRPEAVRTDTAHWITYEKTNIGNAELKPGNYQLQTRETENRLDILRDGKVVVQVPCHWIQLPKKSDETEVVTDRNEVLEVQFEGRTEAIQLR